MQDGACSTEFSKGSQKTLLDFVPLETDACDMFICQATSSCLAHSQPPPLRQPITDDDLSLFSLVSLVPM